MAPRVRIADRKIEDLPNGRVITEVIREHSGGNKGIPVEQTLAVLEELGHPENKVLATDLAMYLGITYAAARNRMCRVRLMR